MLTTPHVMTAIAIYLSIPNKALALILAFLSHFILDFFIPHWNPHIYSEIKSKNKLSLNTFLFIFYDALLALILAIIIILRKLWPDWQNSLIMLTACFLAVLPDLIEIPYYFFKSKHKLLKAYVEFEHQKQANANIFWGIVTQIVVFALSLCLISRA